MKLAIARAVMAVTHACMGPHRREWSRAMLVEFDAAVDAGEPLSFALGCLLTAVRAMPMNEEGRFAIASHVLAIGVLLPVATLLLFGVASGQPLLAPDVGGLAHGAVPLAVNEGNRAGVPLLAALTSVLGVGHLYVAWAMLDRRWRRVLAAGRLAAAMTMTGALFTGLLFLRAGDALLQASMVAIELTALWTLARWHDELPDPRPEAPEAERC